MIKPGTKIEKEQLDSVIGRYIPYHELSKGVMRCSKALIGMCIEDMLISGYVSATTRQIQTHLQKMKYWPEWTFISRYRTKNTSVFGKTNVGALLYKLNTYSDRVIRHIEYNGCTRIKKTGPNGGGAIIWDLTTFKGVRL